MEAGIYIIFDRQAEQSVVQIIEILLSLHLRRYIVLFMFNMFIKDERFLFSRQHLMASIKSSQVHW